MRDLSFDQAISFAQDLIRIPGLPGAEGAVASRVRDELEALGFHDVRFDEVGNVIGVAPGRGGAPAVMLSCHLDSVDVGDASTWERSPFSGAIEDGFLHGRGAMDIKGPLAIQTYAAARFLDEPAAGDVIVAHTVLEERGGLGMAHLMASGKVRPAAVIIGEATAGDVCIGHRGRAEMVAQIEGVAGHASAPARAHNPLDVLPDVLRAVGDFAAQLAREPDLILGPSTIAATAIRTLPSSHNVIPDRVRLVLDWRVLPGPSREDLLQRLRSQIQQEVNVQEPYRLTVAFATETQTTWTGLAEDRPLFTPGFLIDAGHPIATAAARAIEQETRSRPAIRPWTFATDGGHTCGVYGIPTLGYGPGEERFAHTNRERLDLEQAKVVFDAYPAVIRSVQSAAVEPPADVRLR